MHILYRQRKDGDFMLMNYVYYINGEERDATPEERQILLDRFMDKLGYERVNKDEDGEKEEPVV